MSAQAHGAPLSPIEQSSTPRCPCQAEQPCVCERFAGRLEKRWQEMQMSEIEAVRFLEQARAALERIRLSADQQIALAAVRAALELL